MLLVAVKPRRKHLTALQFSEDYLPKNAAKSDEGFLLIDSDLCIERKLTAGQSFEPDDIDELFLESEKRRAKSRALWMLSRRDYASGEMQKKLREKFMAEAADYATCRMVELGLINDVSYAKHLAESLIAVRGVAPRQAPYLMAQKGVDLALAKEIVAEREDDPREAIKKLIETKYLRKLTDNKGSEKVFAALIRKGFSYGDVRAVMESFTDVEYYEEY